MEAVFDRTFEHSQALFSAAIDEFSSHGYENASINAILAEAGMSKGQFYYHFGGKEDLYFALIAAVLQRKQAYFADLVTEADWQGDLFDILSRQLAYGLEFSLAYPDINRFADSFIREQGSPIYEKALARFQLGSGDFVEKLINNAYKKGELRDDLPLAFIRQAIGYLFTHAVDVAGFTQVASAQENLEYLVKFMRSGFQKPA